MVDGVLREVMSVRMALQGGVLARLKVLANLGDLGFSQDMLRRYESVFRCPTERSS